MLNIGLKQRMPVPAGQLGPVAGSHAILMALGTVALVVDDFLSVGLLTTQSTHRPLASEPPAAGVQSRRPLKVSPPERLSLPRPASRSCPTSPCVNLRSPPAASRSPPISPPGSSPSNVRRLRPPSTLTRIDPGVLI